MNQLTFKKHSQSFQFGEHTVTLETGHLARQATGAVKVTMGDTVLLVTVVASKEVVKGRDFFPLSVHYIEKMYAGGTIPGSFHRREGRPSERETLISRLTDRSLRPLFDKGFKQEVQVIATVLSYDPQVSTDIPCIIGSAAAVALAGLPFAGPLAAARVGYIDNNYVLNPSDERLADSSLDLVVSGTRDAIMMVESEAKELSEEVMLGAVMYGQQQMQCAIDAIDALVSDVNVQTFEWTPECVNESWVNQVKTLAEDRIKAAYQESDKAARYALLSAIGQEVVAAMCTEEEGAPEANAVETLVHDLQATVLRTNILDTHSRIDGRDLKTVRPIHIGVNELPRVHGSAIFTRGETQAIVATTLGVERDALLLDDLRGKDKDKFLLHYNFPAFSVGEVGFVGSPKRREIGHGRLARRSLEAVLPTFEEFPYVVRVVSEITESNGSSSMATVCGGSLALMDAGVPIKAPVAGIAMGLIKDGDRVAVLTDILGDEDHLGDMDFKVAGTLSGVTALQMDIKIHGITESIMSQALAQAKDGRMHILSLMQEVISTPRSDVSEYAPRMIKIKINPDKIRDVIGKGGSVIREITETTNTVIDITDDGVVSISAVDAQDGAQAKAWVERLTEEAEVGVVYDAKVVKIMDFGAFVELPTGQQGLVHVSQISQERVENVRDKLTENQAVQVKLLEIDRQGRLRLSMKAVDSVET